MSLQNNTFSNRNTFDVNTQKRHKKDLGLDIPKDYFSVSKKNILEKTINKKKSKVIRLYKNVYLWSAVAVVALLITFVYTTPLVTQTSEVENDILLASLFIEESNVDALVDDYLDDELLTNDVFSE
ncbi:hypothetical protein OAT18_03385 [Tenacibaculum sp.]|nr:hypothetical protein [Tenacibaculum sp.]